MKVLMTHRNTSNARSKTPSELLNGRKVRIPAIIDYPIGGDVIYRPTEKSQPVPAQYIVRKGTNTAWISEDQETILASNNQIGRLPAPTLLMTNPHPMEASAITETQQDAIKQYNSKFANNVVNKITKATAGGYKYGHNEIKL